MEKQDISVNSIKNTYKKVYNFFFKYFIYIIIWILWIITIINIFSHKKLYWKKRDFIIERARLLWEFNKNKQTNRRQKIQIHILNWNIMIEVFILTIIRYYDWIILPKILSYTKPNCKVEYFKNTDYDISELENIAKHNFHKFRSNWEYN